jgi:hypothetical protein
MNNISPEELCINLKKLAADGLRKIYCDSCVTNSMFEEIVENIVMAAVMQVTALQKETLNKEKHT